jgi:hypothetical protein
MVMGERLNTAAKLQKKEARATREPQQESHRLWVDSSNSVTLSPKERTCIFALAVRLIELTGPEQFITSYLL